MAKLIVILDRRPRNDGDGARLEFGIAFRLVVPAGRAPFYANPNATSTVKAADTADVNELKAGTLVEVVDSVTFPAGTAIAVIETGLANRHATMQAALNADPTYARYGSSWDGTTWTRTTNP